MLIVMSDGAPVLAQGRLEGEQVSQIILTERALGNVDVPGDLSHRFGVFPSKPYCSLTELGGMGLRHTDSFPGRLILLRISVRATGAISYQR